MENFDTALQSHCSFHSVHYHDLSSSLKRSSGRNRKDKKGMKRKKVNEIKVSNMDGLASVIQPHLLGKALPHPWVNLQGYLINTIGLHLTYMVLYSC